MPSGRAEDRADAVLFRMSVEDKKELKRLAHERGINMQMLLEERVFGRLSGTPRGPWDTRMAQDPIEELRMTG